MKKVVNIRKDDGTVTAYEPYADRLKAFLVDFPVKDGWKRVAEPVMPGEIVGGFDDFYREHVEMARAAGVPSKRVVAYRARLINPAGEVAVQVHKIGIVETWSDVMTAETRALDRILVHCGYGSDPADDLSADVRMVEGSLDLSSATKASESPATEDVPTGPSEVKEVAETPSDTLAAAPRPLPTIDITAKALKAPKRRRPVETESTEAKSEPAGEAAPTGPEPEAPPPASEPAPPEAAKPSAPAATAMPASERLKPAGALEMLADMVEQLQRSKGLPVERPQNIEDARAQVRKLSFAV